MELNFSQQFINQSWNQFFHFEQRVNQLFQKNHILKWECKVVSIGSSNDSTLHHNQRPGLSDYLKHWLKSISIGRSLFVQITKALTLLSTLLRLKLNLKSKMTTWRTASSLPDLAAAPTPFISATMRSNSSGGWEKKSSAKQGAVILLNFWHKMSKKRSKLSSGRMRKTPTTLPLWI